MKRGAGARGSMRWPGAWLLSWLAAVALGACALGDGAADGNSPDAGTGGALCQMRLAVTPDVLRAPVGIEAMASIDSNGLTGIYSYEWSVSFEGAPVSVTPLAGGAAIAFQATAPGTYQVVLRGAIGDAPCLDAVEAVNVADPAAGGPAYRLRLLPRTGQPIPIQEIAGGTLAGEDVALGTLGVSYGVAVAGTVESDSGAPLAAYLRAVPRGAVAPWRVEGFSGSDGGFSLRLEDARHDVLVVPLDRAYAPVLLADLGASPSWTLRVPAAPELAGTLVDPQAGPLAGAQVSVRAGELPAVLATTDGAGAFAVPVRAGAARFTVVPPAGTGLPWLELPAGVTLDSSAGALEIAYDPALETTPVTATSPAPLPGARATWVARDIPGAGSVSAAGGDPIALDGTMRLPVSAGAAGEWPEIALPRAVYDVILEPADPGAASPVTLLEVDLGTPGASPVLAPAAAATLAGTVVDAGGEPVAGVEVVATPLGLLAQSAGAGAHATTAAGGSFALAVTAGGRYELVLDSPDQGHARVRMEVPEAPAPGQSEDLGELALPPAVRATGRLVLLASGAAAAGVTVQLMCTGCAAPALPAAEAVTDAFGSFALRVPAAPAP